MERDRKWVEEQVGGEMDILMTPGENKFRSLRWDLNDYDPSDISCGNWGVWGFRGKRYVPTISRHVTIVGALLTMYQVRNYNEGWPELTAISWNP